MKRMAMMGGGLILLAASAALAGQAQQSQPTNQPKNMPRAAQSMPTCSAITSCLSTRA